MVYGGVDEDCGGSEGPRGAELASRSCACGGNSGPGAGRENPGREGECGIVTLVVGGGDGILVPGEEEGRGSVSCAVQLMIDCVG